MIFTVPPSKITLGRGGVAAGLLWRWQAPADVGPRGPGWRVRGGGVTLVELVVVMAILGLIAAIGAPMYTSHLQKMRNDAAITDIRLLEVQIERFRTDSGRLPDALAELGVAIPDDPWGSPYQYLNLTDLAPGDKGKRRKDRNLVPINSDYDLYSQGPDGESKGPLTAKTSQDDIVRASNGGFVGLATEH